MAALLYNTKRYYPTHVLYYATLVFYYTALLLHRVGPGADMRRYAGRRRHALAAARAFDRFSCTLLLLVSVSSLVRADTRRGVGRDTEAHDSDSVQDGAGTDSPTRIRRLERLRYDDSDKSEADLVMRVRHEEPDNSDTGLIG